MPINTSILVDYTIVFVQIPVLEKSKWFKKLTSKYQKASKVYMCENFISTLRALKLSIKLLRDCQNHVSQRSLLIIPVTFNDVSTNGPFICSIIGYHLSWISDTIKGSATSGLAFILYQG